MGTTKRGRSQWSLIVTGAVLSLFGLALLLGRIEHRAVLHFGQLWPLMLIAVAAGVAGGNRSQRDLRKGLILLAVGSWFLANTLELGGLDYGSSWPLLLILIGLAITVTPAAGRRASWSAEGPILILWGVLAWIATHQLWGLSWGTVWPLALVAIGVAMVWRAVAEQIGDQPRTGEDLDHE